MSPRWRIRSQSNLFMDRAGAGRQLGARLSAWSNADAVVLALPRGGVPVAAEVAHLLGKDLDVVIARKIGSPRQPELAVGAVTADGGLFLDTAIIDRLGITPDRLDQLIAAERHVAIEQELRFRENRPMPRLARRTAILVDDGLATGATMCAAIHGIRRHRPDRIVVAVPVGPKQACDDLMKIADDVICLYTPEPFRSVGAFYHDFGQVPDDEVSQILDEFSDHHL